MKKVHSLIPAVLLSLVLPYATAAQAPALQSGSMLIGVTGAAGVLFMLHEAVGVDAQLFLSRHTQEQGDLERTRTLGGLRLGISAFVF